MPAYELDDGSLTDGKIKKIKKLSDIDQDITMESALFRWVFMKFFQMPSAGDIVWCLFPESLGKTNPTHRPALAIKVRQDSKHKPIVTVIYGTKKINQLYPSEFKMKKRC